MTSKFVAQGIGLSANTYSAHTQELSYRRFPSISGQGEASGCGLKYFLRQKSRVENKDLLN